MLPMTIQAETIMAIGYAIGSASKNGCDAVMHHIQLCFLEVRIW